MNCLKATGESEPTEGILARWTDQIWRSRESAERDRRDPWIGLAQGYRTLIKMMSMILDGLRINVETESLIDDDSHDNRFDFVDDLGIASKQRLDTFQEPGGRPSSRLKHLVRGGWLRILGGIACEDR